MQANDTKKLCGAKLRGGGRCKRYPMSNGRCRLHGGATPSGPASPHFKHGRYASVFRRSLAEKFTQSYMDDKPLDLLPELAVQRAVLAQHIETVSNKARPEFGSLRQISMLANDVTRTVERIAKIRQDTALTIAEIKFIQLGMMRILDKYVPDPNRRRDFIKELRGLVSIQGNRI